MSQNTFDSKDKKKFINALNFKLPPFDKFVSKGDLEEWDPSISSREESIIKIAELLNTSENSIMIPIIGDVGAGKTHFMWSIKNSFEVESFASFINLPRSKEKFDYYIYSDLIEDFGADRIRDLAQDFGDSYGANERLYGLFKTQNITKVVLNAYEKLKDKFESKNALQQCITVLIQHLMKRDTIQITERWLLGQLMEMDDLFTINVNDDLSGKNLAKTMLKLMIENYSQGIVLLFDDFDKACEEYKDLADIWEYEETNWANDIDNTEDNGEEGNNDVPETLQEKITQYLEGFKNVKLVISLDEEHAEAILSWFKSNIDPKYIAEPIYLNKFTFQDAQEIYFSRIEEFCKANRLKHPATEPDFNAKKNLREFYKNYQEDLYYPIARSILETLYNASEGNVREFLRNLKKMFDGIIFEELKLENLDSEFEKYLKF